MWDVFICHANEDKDAVARPLASRLESVGVTVWLDETALRIGDSLRKGIDEGLARSRYGILILSPDFFANSWTQAELGALISKESVDQRVVLPVWHRMSAQEVRQRSPLLADRLAVRWEDGIETVVARILEVVRPSRKPDDRVTLFGRLRGLQSLDPNYRIVAPADMRYNSFAWAAGDVERWWHPSPSAFWPPNVDRIATVGAVLRAFETLGYRVCTDATAEPGYEKIAIHTDETGVVTHAARQVSSGKWTSKLGSLELIEYGTVDLLVALYGRVTLFMKRATQMDCGPNLSSRGHR